MNPNPVSKGRVLLRDKSCMGTHLGRHALRIAVKDGEMNKKMIAILKEVFRIQK